MSFTETITGQLEKLGLTVKQLAALDPFIKRFRNSATSGCWDTYIFYHIIAVKQFSSAIAIILRTEISDTWKGKITCEDNVYIVLEGKLYVSRSYKHRLSEVEKMETDNKNIALAVINKRKKRFEEQIPLKEPSCCRTCPLKNEGWDDL